MLMDLSDDSGWPRPAMVDHGHQPLLAMIGHVRPWPVISGHGQPCPAMASHALGGESPWWNSAFRVPYSLA